MEALGYNLVELNIVPQHGSVRIAATVAMQDASKDMGVADVAKAHRALAPCLMSLLGKNEDEVSMEVCSPGVERNLKNANEFVMFKGREVRVWDKNVSDWVSGVIKSADEKCVTLEKEGESPRTIAYIDIAKAKFLHL